MSSLNKVMLIGNLGNDPELKYTQGGTAVCKLSLATSERRKDRDGNVKETTEWHRVTLFGKQAEIGAEYLRKGHKVYIEGRLRYGKYTDQAGVERYTTDILSDVMQMLTPRPSSDAPAQRSANAGSRSSPMAKPPAPPAAGNDFADDFADDDIPF